MEGGVVPPRKVHQPRWDSVYLETWDFSVHTVRHVGNKCLFKRLADFVTEITVELLMHECALLVIDV